MERKVKFTEGEYYHLFTRGVEKRKIFLETRDYERMLALLYILNQEDHFHVSNFFNRGKTASEIYKIKKGKLLISILGYSLMPNHFHVVVREIKRGGISKFMSKVLTAYSMFFNKKYERSGPLFVRPFRSSHIGDDVYFRHIFSYIHLNCIELKDKDWKENGLKDRKKTKEFLESYRYSSYSDFQNSRKRNESQIVDFASLPDFISRAPLDIREYEKWWSSSN